VIFRPATSLAAMGSNPPRWASIGAWAPGPAESNSRFSSRAREHIRSWRITRPGSRLRLLMLPIGMALLLCLFTAVVVPTTLNLQAGQEMSPTALVVRPETSQPGFF